ncbi:MAG: CRISPR-associated endonuclease Cas1 [Myxococcota bacterium]
MGRPYYIFSNGRIKRDENTILIENDKGEKKTIPVEDTENIHIFGEIDLNTKFLNFVSQHKISIHIYNIENKFNFEKVVIGIEKDMSGNII